MRKCPFCGLGMVLRGEGGVRGGPRNPLGGSAFPPRLSVLICMHRRNVDLRERRWSVSHRLVASLCEGHDWFWIPRHPQSHQWVSICSVPVWSASSDHGRTFFRVPLSIACLPVVDCCSSTLGFVSPSRHLPLFCPTLPPEFVSFSRTEVGNP